MPWCEDCSKFWNPSSMTPEGACPTCGRTLEAPEPTVRYDAKTIDVRALAGEDAKAPWHFKLLITAVVLYLLWRLIELVGWVL